jgi:hypothetical protein
MGVAGGKLEVTEVHIVMASLTDPHTSHEGWIGADEH